MIKNSKQASLSKDKLKEIRIERAAFDSSKDEHTDLEHMFGLETFDALISDLEEQLRIYNGLKTQGYNCLKNKSIEDVSEILISCRLAQGMSHKDLAEASNLQEQQIQRYEATDYESASLTRILEIADALNITLSFRDIEIFGKKPEFQIPKGMSEDIINDAEEFIRNQGLLVLD